MPGSPKRSLCVAMCWNGEADENGYPSTRGNPQWFAVEQRPRQLNRRAALAALRHHLLEDSGEEADRGHETGDEERAAEPVR